MPQFYPDGPTAVTLNAIQENGTLTMPPQEDLNTPGLQGSMQQILSENLGKFVIADFLIGVSTIVRRVGVLYSVGRGYVTLYLAQYNAFEVCDVFSLKFVTFFAPGSEPSIEQLNQGLSNSGILTPSQYERARTPLGNMGGGVMGGGALWQNGAGGASQGVNNPAGTGTGGASSGRGQSGSTGCRVLGQR